MFMRKKLSEMRFQTKILVTGVILLVCVLAKKLYEKDFGGAKDADV